MTKSLLKLLPAVEEEGYGAGVYEVDVHHGAEAAGFDAGATGAEPGDEFFVEGLGDLGRCSLVEGGAPALTAVAVEGELGDDEERAADIRDGEIHLAVGVLEYAERKNLVGEVIGVGGGIVLARAEENENPLSYTADGFAANFNFRFFYTLDYSAHGLYLVCIPVCRAAEMNYNMDYGV